MTHTKMLNSLRSDFLFLLFSFCMVYAERPSSFSFFYKNEKIEICQTECRIKYEKKYANVLLRHEGTTVYLIGNGRDVIRFLYDSGFRLERIVRNNQIDKKNVYTYKLNELYATNLEYRIYVDTGFSFFPKDLRVDEEKMIFTVSARTKIDIVH